MSIVGPAQTATPPGCLFSGEIDGQVTSHLCFGSSTRVSMKNCAAPFITGYARARNCLSPVNS